MEAYREQTEGLSGLILTSLIFCILYFCHIFQENFKKVAFLKNFKIQDRGHLK